MITRGRAVLRCIQILLNDWRDQPKVPNSTNDQATKLLLALSSVVVCRVFFPCRAERKWHIKLCDENNMFCVARRLHHMALRTNPNPIDIQKHLRIIICTVCVCVGNARLNLHLLWRYISSSRRSRLRGTQ